MGERCENAKRLTDYGICEDFISQACSISVSAVLLTCRQRPAPFSWNAGRMKDFTGVLQVVGFVVNPETPGRRFVDGVLVPCE